MSTKVNKTIKLYHLHCGKRKYVGDPVSLVAGKDHIITEIVSEKYSKDGYSSWYDYIFTAKEKE